MPHKTRSHHRHHSGPLRRQGPVCGTAGDTPFRSDAELSLAFHRHHRTLVRQVQELRRLVDELTEFFGVNCYWILWKEEEWKVREAFKICQEKQITKVGYLLGIIKRI